MKRFRSVSSASDHPAGFNRSAAVRMPRKATRPSSVPPSSPRVASSKAKARPSSAGGVESQRFTSRIPSSFSERLAASKDSLRQKVVLLQAVGACGGGTVRIAQAKDDQVK